MSISSATIPATSFAVTSPDSATEVPPLPALPRQRLSSLDAYRGFVMLLMASEALSIPAVARNFPGSSVWRFFAFHFDHVPWAGGSLWDMIQPSFMFIVGVALPFSLAGRLARGDSFGRLLGRALWRSLLLVLLGIFLRSIGRPRTNFMFTDVLGQIGLGYPILFLLAWVKPRWQVVAAGALLLGAWLAFALYPAPGPGYDFAAVGVPANWPYHLHGFAAHWDKNANLGLAFDRWLLNLFPRSQPFAYSEGGYATLNFVPALATMIFGLLAGGLLRARLAGGRKCLTLVLAGVLGLLLGKGLDWLGINPIVKRIWTPAWTIYSTGWTCLLLAGFYAVIDLAGQRRWAFALIVVGMNSLAMYLMAHLFPDFIARTLMVHFGPSAFYRFGAVSPIVRSSAVLLILWLFCLWMYRRKIFLRI